MKLLYIKRDKKTKETNMPHRYKNQMKSNNFFYPGEEKETRKQRKQTGES